MKKLISDIISTIHFLYGMDQQYFQIPIVDKEDATHMISVDNGITWVYVKLPNLLIGKLE